MFLAPASNAAQPLRGALDPSFGHGGRAFSDLGPGFASSGFTSVIRQSDGKLLLAGAFGVEDWEVEAVVQRREPDGRLDLGFGTGGTVVVAHRGHGGPSALAIDGDGRSLVGVGQSSGLCGATSTVLRLDRQGTPDPTFGDDGKSRMIPLGSERIAVDAHGRILVAGSAGFGPCTKSGNQYNLAIARLRPDGTLDPSFGDDGRVETGAVADVEDTFATGLAVGEDGSILVAGDRSVLRLTSDGALDAGFGNGGVVEPPPGPQALLALPGGDLIVAGSSSSGYGGRTCCLRPGDFVVSRYRPDGSPDPRFGDAGHVSLDVGEIDDVAALVRAPAGGLVLAGNITASDACLGGDCRFTPILARLTLDGRLDPSFGEAGLTAPGLPGGPPTPYFIPPLAALAIAPSGQILLAGGAGRYGDAFVLARRPDGSPDTSFGDGGSVQRVRRLPSETVASHLAVGPGGRVLVSGWSNTGMHSWRDVVLGFRRGGRPDRRFGAGAGFAAVGQSDGPLGVDGRGRIYAVEGHHLGRFAPGGRPDRGYGSEGLASLPGGFAVGALRVRRDGSAIVAGRLAERPGMAVFRLTSDGRPDRRFGKGGLAVAGSGRDRWARAVSAVVDPEGRVVLLGKVGARTALVRFLPDGRRDTGFGGPSGFRVLPFADPDKAAVAIHPGGGILVAGTGAGAPGISLLRLRVDGRRDRSFGRRGHVRVGRVRVREAEPLAILPGRRQIVLVVSRGSFGESGVVLAGYRPDGSIDRRFGRGGALVAAASQPRPFRPVAAARQPNGRVVVAGTVGRIEESGADVGLLRFR